MSDFRYAIRSLLGSPVYTIVVIATLAIGIGPTTAIFSVVHALLIRELPYRDIDSLVVVWRFRNAGDHAPVSGPDFADFRERNTTMSEMTASTYANNFNIGGVVQPVRVEGARVTANFFALLGAPPLSGVLPNGSPIGDAKSVILGYDLWKQTFGGAPVIGKTTRLNGEPYVIAAVMPRDFGFPQKAQLWIPYDLTPERYDHRAWHRLSVIGRLKPGVSIEKANADVTRVAAHIAATHPDTSRGIGAQITSLRDTLAGDVRKPLLILLGAVAFLLLIACSNVANLALTRASSRAREISVRMAVGASTARVARQLFTEALLLSLAGGFAGLALAQLSISALRRLGGAYLARPETIGLDIRMLAVNFSLSVFTGVVFGLAALAARGEPFDALRNASRSDGHGGREGVRAREAIVVVVIAFSLILLIGAGLMIRSFEKVRAIDVGVRTEGAVTLKLFLPPAAYPDLEARRRFYEQFVRRLGEAGGIDAAAAVSGLPLQNTMSGDVVFPGEADPIAARRIATFTEISPGYFSAAGVPVLEGRDFTWDDIHGLAQAGRAPMLVNQTFAKRFTRAAIGQELLIGGEWPGTIIGVVGDVKQTDPRKPTPAHVYLPLGTPLPPAAMSFVIRSSSRPPNDVVAIAKGILREMAPDIPPYQVRPMAEVVSDAQSGARFQAVLLVGFAIAALLLATGGIYGVISYTVARRTREVAVRMAVGAAAWDVMRLVLLRVLRLTSYGLAIGVTGALLLTGSMRGVLFEIEPADPGIFAGIAALTLITALIASAVPARRAAALDPMAALRAD